MFLRIFQHLLPNAKAWRLTIDKQLRQFFQGLTGLGSDVRDFVDLVWLDIFPETTRELTAWEGQFGLPDTLTIEQERRDRLDATWKAVGGQDPRYIEDTLRAAGFDVYVHEWWADLVPTARNPLLVLNDGTGTPSLGMTDGGADAQDGDADSQDGFLADPAGFALVNKIFVGSTAFIGDGALGMNDGAAAAQDGFTTTAYTQKLYPVPSDPTKWPYFLYIGGQTYPDHATVQTSRKNEFESLCLKICPAQQWLGMLITYT